MKVLCWLVFAILAFLMGPIGWALWLLALGVVAFAYVSQAVLTAFSHVGSDVSGGILRKVRRLDQSTLAKREAFWGRVGRSFRRNVLCEPECD